MKEPKLRCKGTTKKGEHCTKGAQDDGYCRQHASQAPEEQLSVEVREGQVTGVEPVVRERPQRRSGGRSVVARASRAARALRGAPAPSGTVGFSKPTTLCHAKKMPRGIDLQVKASLHHYRTWASLKTADEREAKRRRRVAVLRDNEAAARARQKAAAR